MRILIVAIWVVGGYLLITWFGPCSNGYISNNALIIRNLASGTRCIVTRGKSDHQITAVLSKPNQNPVIIQSKADDHSYCITDGGSSSDNACDTTFESLIQHNLSWLSLEEAVELGSIVQQFSGNNIGSIRSGQIFSIDRVKGIAPVPVGIIGTLVCMWSFIVFVAAHALGVRWRRKGACATRKLAKGELKRGRS